MLSDAYSLYMEIAVAGIVSLALAYAIDRWRSSFHKIAPPRPGTRFSLSHGEGSLEAILRGYQENAWLLELVEALPDNFEIEKGSIVQGEYLSATGVLRFRSEVFGQSEDGMLSIKAPSATKIGERRSEPRERTPREVYIERHRAFCIDLSPLGGRFETDYEAHKGERVRLDFPQLNEPIFGWVLETYPKQLRVRFEDRLAQM